MGPNAVLFLFCILENFNTLLKQNLRDFLEHILPLAISYFSFSHNSRRQDIVTLYSTHVAHLLSWMILFGFKYHS